MPTESERKNLIKKICDEIHTNEATIRVAQRTMMSEGHADPSDVATDEALYTEAIREMERARGYLRKLNVRLAEIMSGDCCKCECGETIPFERLMAKPTTKHCVSCKWEMEESLRLRNGIRPGMPARTQA